MGTLVKLGNGSVQFTPTNFGNGVKFLPGGQQNGDAAFYKYTGSQIGNIFDMNNGEISFKLTSNTSAAQRTLFSNGTYVFDVRDGLGTQLFQFSTFSFNNGGTIKYMFTIAGKVSDIDLSDSHITNLLDAGTTNDIKLKWDLSKVEFYVNNTLMQSLPRAAVTADWSANSIFTFGSQATSGGGFFASTDTIDEFKVQGLSNSPTPTPTPTPTPPPSGALVGDINLDHIVNSIDYSILNSKWFTADTTSDLNHDGIVNTIDFSLLNANWFKTW